MILSKMKDCCIILVWKGQVFMSKDKVNGAIKVMNEDGTAATKVSTAAGSASLPSSGIDDLESLLEIEIARDSAVVETLEKYESVIITRDPAPQLLGIPIKPTLLNVLAAYLVSAAGIVITKFFTSNA